MTHNSPSPRFITSTILLSFFSVLNMSLGFGGIVVITHHFTTETYGAFALILVVVSFLGQISALGLDMSIPRFIAGAKDDSNKERIFSTAVTIKFGSILSASLLCWLSWRFLMLLFGKSLVPDYFPFILLMFVLESFRLLYRSVLQGFLLFARIGFTDLINNSLYFVLLLAVVLKADGAITWLILAKSFSSLAAGVFAFLSVPIKKRLSFHVDSFKDLIKFGFPLQINDIFQFIQSRVDTLVIASLLGPGSIALYEIGRKIPDQLRSLYGPFIQVFYPFFSKKYALGNKQQSDKLVNDSTRFVAFFTLFGTAIAILFNKDIIRLFFSEKYLPSAPIFIVLMINLSIALVSNVMGTTLVAVGDTQKPMIINFVNGTASWLGSILLIPILGIIGASAANTIGTTLAFPLNRYFVGKRIGMKDSSYLKPLALICVWGALIFILKPESLLLKLFLLLVFLIACGFLSIITKKDITLLFEGIGISSWHPLKKIGIWISKS